MTTIADTTSIRGVKNKRYRRNILLKDRVAGKKMGLFLKEAYFPLLKVCSLAASDKDMDIIESILDGATKK